MNLKFWKKKRKLVIDKTHYRYNWTFKIWMHDGQVRFHHEPS